MADIDLYFYNQHQASASDPFSGMDASVNADADTTADARWGQCLMKRISSSLIPQSEFL